MKIDVWVMWNIKKNDVHKMFTTEFDGKHIPFIPNFVLQSDVELFIKERTVDENAQEYEPRQATLEIRGLTP